MIPEPARPERQVCAAIREATIARAVAEIMAEIKRIEEARE